MRKSLVDKIEQSKQRGAVKSAWEAERLVNNAKDILNAYPDLNKMPQQQGYVSIAWSEIIDKQTFDPGDRGFYGVSVTINYKGPGGVPMKAYADGYIFLHVVKKEYLPLSDSGGEDEYFVWSWKIKTNQTAKMTTGARVFVSQKQ